MCQLFHGDAVVVTDGGHPIQARSALLLRLMVDEIERVGGVECINQRLVGAQGAGFFTAYTMHHDVLDSASEFSSGDFRACLLRDPILRDVAGRERVDQLIRYQPVYDYFKVVISQLRSVVEQIDQSFGESSPELETAQRDAGPACEHVRAFYLDMPNRRRAALLVMRAWHGGQMLAPIALIVGGITIDQYTDAVLASQALIPGVFSDVSRAEGARLREQVKAQTQALFDYAHLAALSSTV